MENTFEFARQNLKKSAERQKRYYDHKAKETLFKVGDWACCYYPPAARYKFGSGWTGPYLGIKVMCPVDPDSEDKPRNWMTESEVIGESPMNSGDEESPQEVDERQEEGQNLADLDGSHMEAGEETQVDTSLEDPSLPKVEVPMGCRQRRRKPNPRYHDSA